MRLKTDRFLLALIGIILCCCQPAFAQQGWHSLLNGQDLDGREKKNGTETYEIRNEAIVGISQLNTPNTFLCTKETYADFISETEVKIGVDLNYGIHIRRLSIPEVTSGQSNGEQEKI